MNTKITKKYNKITIDSLNNIGPIKAKKNASEAKPKCSFTIINLKKMEL